jgi:hypothetical protein
LGVHTVAEHHAVGSQSALDAQLVAHDVAEAHRYGAHEVVDRTHTPAPSQNDPVFAPMAHETVPHAMPEGANVRHWPAPSHVPSALQDEGYPGSGRHPPLGFVPAGASPHTPFTPEPLRAARHDLHGEVHA